jgi:hypothetical protein
MSDSMKLARQIVLDVLALRVPDSNDAPVFMRAVDPEHMDAERLRLAQRFTRYVPRSTTLKDVDSVAYIISRVLRFTS